MAGDVAITRLLLGLGLRSFSMHPAQILAVKQEVLRADTQRLAPWAQDADLAGITQLERAVPQEERRAQRPQAHDGQQQPVARGQRGCGLQQHMAQQRQQA
jgi:phosphotransferase system enzyme I (PtsI)